MPPPGGQPAAQAAVWEVFKKRPVMKTTLRQLRQFNNYELTMMTLKGETFAGFKIQRQSVFYFVIDVASVILSMCIGLLRQCTK